MRAYGLSAKDAVIWGLTIATVVILAVMWLNLYALHAGGRIIQIDRNTVLSKDIVDAAGLSSLGLIVAVVVMKIRRKSVPILLQEILAELRPKPRALPNGGSRSGGIDWGTLRHVIRVGLYDVFLLGKMGACEDFQQWLGHFLTMWGFIGLFITTSLDAIVNPGAHPLPLLHPVRVLGNVSGTIFMAGLTIAIARRALRTEVRHVTTRSDILFLMVMYGTGLSGFLVQWYADHGDAQGTAFTYLMHLFFVALLIPTAPWTKFIHALWRPSWVIHSSLMRAKEGR
ncbi:MAG: respiratory nitrate reductase subunit gamma [Thaumarchaeota archaeon]|nr:respiratory nitrate reductase subunit gamma [Candidatus Calditenuaceae archaeon]MDW8041558.1 respiratory nitrate reductase subunit gamma [Nitrososphaerota archaeon]